MRRLIRAFFTWQRRVAKSKLASMQPGRLWLVAVGLWCCAETAAAKPWYPRISKPAGESVARAPTPVVERTAAFKKALQVGMEFLGRGRYPQAIEALGKAIDLCPACAEARLARARALLTVGYLSWNPEAVHRALADAQAAGEISPGDGEPRMVFQLASELWRRMFRTARAPSSRKAVGAGAAGEPAQGTR